MTDETRDGGGPRPPLKEATLPAHIVESRIVMLRGQRVMLSIDLAELYGVEPGALSQAVKRNTERLPEEFMFKLTEPEFANLKSQIVISSWGGRRALPYAFTEQGVAMLSSVLRSPRAVLVNVEIMRAFVRLRRIPADNADLAHRRFSHVLCRLSVLVPNSDPAIDRSMNCSILCVYMSNDQRR